MPSRVDRKKSSRRSRNTRRTKFGHGWIPDRPDRRDRRYVPPPKVVRALPSRVDLKEHCPPVYHQGHVNSCTAHAIAAAIQFDEKKQSALEKKKRMRRSQIQSRSGQAHMFMPSRLFIYYNGRAMGHSVESDDGAEIRNVLKSVKKRGVCHEALWPYRKGKLRHRPWRKCYTAAAKYPGLTYFRVRRTLPQLKACLASGYPFIFGFTVYKSFKKAKHTGRTSMPQRHDRIENYHAVLAVGYEDTQRRFIVRNSWGSKWGTRGYFTLPYDYLTDRHLSEDFWTVRFR